MLRLIRGSSGGESKQRAGAAVEDPLREVARAAAEGQPEAQRTLLVAAGPAMLRAVRGVLGSAPHDVEDTLQEAMVALHLATRSFRGECTMLHFACRIAVQTAMNVRRREGYRRRHTPSFAPEDLDLVATSEQSPAELLAAQRRREALRQLLCTLPQPQAEALAFHCVLGYTIEETSAAIGTPIDTTRSRLRNGLAKLRASIAGDAVLPELLAIEEAT